MNELPTPEEDRERQARQRVYEIMDRHLGKAFEELDRLHHEGMDDRDIIKALEDGGYRDEAEVYQEWIAEDDPSRNYRDPTPHGADAVTDPVDALSYRSLEAEMKARREQKKEQQ
jgi:hypothetical protein